MRWFKFYGQDFLTDTKIIGMDPLLRQVWVTLLCMADDNGQIKHLGEYDLIKIAGCDDDQMSDPSDFDRTKGCLEYFKKREMIALQTVTNSNAAPLHTVTLLRYASRQRENLSNAERQKKYRETHKIATETVTNSNVTQRNDSNARIDKNRIDKNRTKERREETTLSYLQNIPVADIDDFISTYTCSKSQVVGKAEELYNYCKAKGKLYKDYKAFLRNVLNRDYGKRPPPVEVVPEEPPVVLTEEQKQRNLKKLAEIRSKLVNGMGKTMTDGQVNDRKNELLEQAKRLEKN